MKTALKASRTEASGWVLGTIAGCTRTETPDSPGWSPSTRSQIASSLTVQFISRAAAMSRALTSVMPSRWTSALLTRELFYTAITRAKKELSLYPRILFFSLLLLLLMQKR